MDARFPPQDLPLNVLVALKEVIHVGICSCEVALSCGCRLFCNQLEPPDGVQRRLTFSQSKRNIGKFFVKLLPHRGVVLLGHPAKPIEESNGTSPSERLILQQNADMADLRGEMFS